MEQGIFSAAHLHHVHVHHHTPSRVCALA